MKENKEDEGKSGKNEEENKEDEGKKRREKIRKMKENKKNEEENQENKEEEKVRKLKENKEKREIKRNTARRTANGDNDGGNWSVMKGRAVSRSSVNGNQKYTGKCEKMIANHDKWDRSRRNGQESPTTTETTNNNKDPIFHGPTYLNGHQQ